jgi:hypothetical protein
MALGVASGGADQQSGGGDSLGSSASKAPSGGDPILVIGEGLSP